MLKIKRPPTQKCVRNSCYDHVTIPQGEKGWVEVSREQIHLLVALNQLTATSGTIRHRWISEEKNLKKSLILIFKPLNDYKVSESLDYIAKFKLNL